MIHFTFEFGVPFFLTGLIFYVFDNIAFFFLFYAYRQSAAVGGTPLMANQV